MTRKALLLALLTTALVGIPAAAQAADYHHVHLTATDELAAARWYMDHMDCQDYGREGACQVDGIQIIFYNDREPTGGSVGSGVDHIGFSFTDLEGRMAGWKAAGVKIVEDIREVQGLFKLAFVEDPWGNNAAIADMQARGVELESGPREIVNRVGQQLKIAFVVTAEGVRIELVEVMG